MASITSYGSGTLKLSDYLIGTDVSTENVTRSMPVSDIVASILAIKSIGTVTSISTSNSTFVNLAGGPITTTGSLTASLSATGLSADPETKAQQFLKGDNTWSLPGPTPTDISAEEGGVTVVSDVTSLKFTNTGVSASAINNNVGVDVPGLLSSVENIIDGIGITAAGTVTTNPSTGNVTITNDGVYQARAGGHVTLTGSATPLQYSSDVTINTLANPGEVISVNPGLGITINNNLTIPEIDINYIGNNNYIDTGESINTVSQDDIIAFQDISASQVKTTKLNTIPIAALPSIVNYINYGTGTAGDSGDRGKVSNLENPAFNNVWKAKQIVSLTLTEYNQLTPIDKNTLYLIVGAGLTYTVNLVYANWNSIVYSTGGVASQSDYSVTTEVDDGNGYVDVTSNPQIIGISGTTYTFRTTITGLNGYTVSGVSGNTTSGTIAPPGATETQTITAVLTTSYTGNCTVTLTTCASVGGSGATSGCFANASQTLGNLSITGDTTGATQIVPINTQYNFSPGTITGTGGYTFQNQSLGGFTGTAPAAANATATGTIYGDLNVISYGTYTLRVYNTRVTLVGGAIASNLGWAISSFCPVNSGAAIGGTPGACATWSGVTPSYSASAQSGGTLSDLGFTFEDASGTAINFAGGYPSGNVILSGNNYIDIYAIGTFEFIPNASQQYRELNAVAAVQAAIGSSHYTLSNPSQQVNGTSGTHTYTVPVITPDPGWTFSPSVPVITLPNIGSNGTITYNSSPWGVAGASSDGLGTQNSRAMENAVTLTPATATAVASPDLITLAIQFKLGNIPYSTPATYSITISSNASTASGTWNSNLQQTFYWGGSGWLTSNPNKQFDIGNGNVTITVSRVGSSWCNSVSTSYCGSYGSCTGPTPYNCGVTVPINPGVISYSGSYSGTLKQWSYGGGYDIVPSQTTTLSFSDGQNLTVYIEEF